jgi:hypothetical protein
MGDPASYSNVTEVRTTNLHIELDVDFERHVLRGCVAQILSIFDQFNRSAHGVNLFYCCSHVDASLEALKDSLKHVVLDTRDLTVSAVSVVLPGAPAQPLQVPIPSSLALTPR